MTDDDWLDVLTEATERVRTEVERYDDMRRGGERPDQYGFDMVADAVVLETLAPTGAGTFSEESGLRAGTTGDVVIIDPVDGSTNASYGIPHYACSLAVRDADGIRIGLVTNLATGERFEAVRGRGALRDGEPVAPTGCERLGDAVVAITGHPNRPIGWAQFRALGACALDVSYVACGVLDAFVDPITQLGLWDYAAAHAIALEAGVVVGEVSGLHVLHGEHSARRGVIYASTPALLAELEAAFAVPDASGGPVGLGDSRVRCADSFRPGCAPRVRWVGRACRVRSFDVIDRLHRLALRGFGLLPETVRHWMVALTSPSYRVGTVGVILSDDGRLLLARHTYRRGWGLPGGMIGWSEEPAETIIREIEEETGLRVAVAGPPHVEHARRPRRVEWFFDLRLDGGVPEDAKPTSAEIAGVEWFPLDALPALEKKSPSTHTALTTFAERHFPGRLAP